MYMLIKAILIDPHTKKVEEVEVENTFAGQNGMYEVMNCDMIETFPLYHYTGLKKKTTLLLDEEVFLKPANTVEFYSIHANNGSDMSFSNRSLIVGTKGAEFSHHNLDIEEVRKLVRF